MEPKIPWCDRVIYNKKHTLGLLLSSGTECPKPLQGHKWWGWKSLSARQRGGFWTHQRRGLAARRVDLGTRGSCEPTPSSGEGRGLEVASMARGQGFNQSCLCDGASIQAQRQGFGERPCRWTRDDGEERGRKLQPFPHAFPVPSPRAIPEPCPVTLTSDAASKMELWVLRAARAYPPNPGGGLGALDRSCCSEAQVTTWTWGWRLKCVWRE